MLRPSCRPCAQSLMEVKIMHITHNYYVTVTYPRKERISVVLIVLTLLRVVSFRTEGPSNGAIFYKFISPHGLMPLMSPMITVGCFCIQHFSSQRDFKKPRSLHSAAPCGFRSRFSHNKCRCIKRSRGVTLCHSASTAFHKHIQLNARVVQTAKHPAVRQR